MTIVCENCGHLNGGTTSIDSNPVCARNTIADQRAALAKLNAEIAHFKTHAEGHIAALEEKRQSILECLGGVVYPILTLPAEITSRIFIQCLPHHGRVRHSPYSAPLLLTGICGQWRAIALSTGELWSSLDVDIDVLWPGRDDVLRMWFPRAKGYPLSWTIRPPTYGLTYDGSVLAAHIADIIPKLRRLEVNSIPEGQFHSLVPLDTPLPLLQCLSAPLSSDTLQDILRCAPNLREVRIWSCMPNFHVASKSLLSLELTGRMRNNRRMSYNIDVFLSILENCPLLSHLKIPVHVAPEAHIPTTPITFPQLRSLTFLRSSGVVRALDFVTLPNLTHLDGRREMTITPNIFQPFLLRSSCVIKDLACRSRPAPKYVEAELGMFPWVETLEVYIPDDIETLRPVLFWLDPDKMTLVPQLRHITIKTSTIKAINFTRIVDLLKRRRGLQSFRVIGPYTPDEEKDDPWWRPGRTTAAELEALRSLGVRFSTHIWTYGYHGDDAPDLEVWPKKDPYEYFHD
ncbi:hypothetical protein GGX14DRAFT_177965 [Mycena pura]|uniref:F-box domain-containing protein n=1 Tax=Mycena pura TaxID=153505 RepID=A0AAD7E1L9_9AGAR|nr:hypothetical protein GGX14DRAFT_177965 [Mycena pura]